jgi:TDG/mug DNA glycosylase family protein
VLPPGLRPGSRVALAGDASRALRRAARERGIELVEASGARAALDAGLALRSVRGAWPAALARLHAALRAGAPLFALPGAHPWLEGAGFRAVQRRGPWLRARRAHTLPDFVRPDLDLLICGLNPSLHAAHSGVPFSRPGNRFWPAALRAGLVARDRDPLAALERGIGFTDFCKRATRRAGELRPAEYARGAARLEQLVRRLRPRALCFVGLEGWRRTLDRSARPGWVEGGFAGHPAYLMPSTSGLNAHADLAQLTSHLASAYTARAHRPP